MKDNQKEPKLTYALNKSGKMVCIDSVDKGLSCECYCPKCNEPLIAKLGNGGRQPHFAHKKDSDCHGSYMTALHKLAEQIIEEEKALMVPAYKEVNEQRLSFNRIEVEQRVERKDLQPDIVGETDDGLRWFIEIRNTHEVNEIKKNKLIESDITCLEIDVREQTLENLKSFLLESSEKREWLNNPIYESQIADAKRKRISIVERLFIDGHELVVPAFSNYGSKKISLENVSVLSKSDDGLYVTIKVDIPDDKPYIFHIGSHDKLENIKGTFEKEREYNELTINIDDLSRNISIQFSNFAINWIYHYASENAQGTKFREYKLSPNYEVKPQTDCFFDCIYQPIHGNCIYKKDSIFYKGIDWVVCNIKKRYKDETEVMSNNRGRSRTSVPSGFEEPEFVSQYVLLPDNLPFENFWIIEDYYKHLQTLGYYCTENGDKAEIVKCDKTSCNILVLYKEPKEKRTYCPYHLAIISIHEGKPKPNRVADYVDKNYAINSYNNRLRIMKKNDKGYDDLPF